MKVLVVKLCCIGDIIQATPALRAVSSSGAKVHFLCSKWVSELVDMIPYVSVKKTVEKPGLLGMLSLLPGLKREKYDMVMNFHRDIKSVMFCAAIGAKVTAGFDWKGQGFLLNRKFVFDPKAHESARYLSVAEGLGFKAAGRETEIKAPFSRKKTPGKISIGLFPGGGKNPGTVMVTKRWPVRYYRELAARLIENGCGVYVFGGAMDRDVTSGIMAGAEGAVLVETGTLKELAGRMTEMDIFIAGDTGPLHMSAALGIRTIGLFGPTSPELVGPPGAHVVNIKGGADCAPCYLPETVHEKKFLECGDNKCMRDISVDRVLEEITNFKLQISG
ncbi:MAG TPA: glycosyltransferase family 9 protein [Candidatus Goldiibacteriota bacterium]|nr:glycosyltransferase family 9 protein [Candidatus Goldiibacteriota bacterium]